jgi:hypothetical protein
MPSVMETRLLRTLTPANLASHLLGLLKKNPASEGHISSELFRLAEAEALSPKVLSIWLSISKSPNTLLRALQQEFSISIRLIGIKNLAKSWRTDHWKELWDGIGGTAGFASLFAQFSVVQVKVFLYHMGRCIRGADIEAKAEAFTELLGRLLLDPDNTTVDERPLIDTSTSSWYAWLLPTDHRPFEESELYQKNRLVWHARHRLLQQYCSNENVPYDSSLSDLEPLLQYDTVEPNLYSESIAFYIQLLRQLIEKPDIASSNNICFFNTLIIPLARRSWNGRKRGGLRQLKEVIDLSLEYLEVHPKETERLNFDHKGFIYYIVISWATLVSDRPFFEAALVNVLQKVRSADKKDFWLRFSSVLGWVRRPLKYSLLRLVFLHYGRWNRNIDLEQDLKDLGIGLWPQEVFLDMDRVYGLDLLQRLRKAEDDDVLSSSRSGGQISVCSSSGEFGDISILLGVLGASGSEYYMHAFRSYFNRSHRRRS